MKALMKVAMIESFNDPHTGHHHRSLSQVARGHDGKDDLIISEFSNRKHSKHLIHHLAPKGTKVEKSQKWGKNRSKIMIPIEEAKKHEHLHRYVRDSIFVDEAARKQKRNPYRKHKDFAPSQKAREGWYDYHQVAHKYPPSFLHVRKEHVRAKLLGPKTQINHYTAIKW